MLINVEYPPLITIDGICEGHDHPRGTDTDGDGRAELIIPMAAMCEEVILAMGNTKDVVNTSAKARRQKDAWQVLVPQGSPARILVAGLLSKNVDPADIVAGFDKPDGEEDWDAMKVFMYGVSNDAGNSVRHFSEVLPQIRAMTHTNWKHKSRKMPLLIHLERKFKDVHSEGDHHDFGERIFILEREYEALKTDLEYLFEMCPEASVTIEHVSDFRTIQLIIELRAKGYDIWGGIAPHYGQYTLDDIFEGPGVNIHLVCWPLFGSEEDRKKIEDAMLDSVDCFYFGSDRACHPHDITQAAGVKISSSGKVLGGQTQIPEATISYVIERHVEEGRLDNLNPFLSGNGMRRFGQQARTRSVWRREDWVVPPTISRYSEELDRTIECVVAAGGKTRKYRFDHLEMIG